MLLKGVTKAVTNETKEQNRGFLSMLLGTSGAVLFRRNLIVGKGIVRDGSGNKKAEWVVRAGYGN